MQNTLKKYIPVFALIFAVLFASCSDLGTEGNELAVKAGEMATVKFAVEDNARSALPTVVASDFGKFVLKAYAGTDTTANPVRTDEYESEYDPDTGKAIEEKEAYTKLMAASVSIEPGEYTFVLTAFVNADKEDCVYVGSYSATGDKKITGGDNSISFTLAPSKLAPAGGKGILALWITNDDDRTCRKATATVYAIGQSGEVEDASLAKEAVVTETDDPKFLVLDWEEIPAGLYKVLLRFYDADGVQIGYNVQYATIVNNAKSSNADLEEILIADAKNPVYTITYRQNGVNFADPAGEAVSWNFQLGVSAPGTYSRFSDVKFPLAASEGYVFLGWYLTETDESLGSLVTKIESNTRTGNLVLTPKFISAGEVPVVTAAQVAVSQDKNPQVGESLHVTAKAGEALFAGTADIQWYRTETEDTDTAIEGATANLYKLTPSDLGKAVFAKVTQKYIVIDEDADGIYSVVKNTTPVASAKTTVLSGTLTATPLYDGDGKELVCTYSGGTVTVTGTALSTENLSPKTAIAKDQAGNDVTVTLSVVENSTVPAVSGYMNLVATAEGYTTATTENAVFVYAKAVVPAAPALSTDTEKLHIGYVAFVSADEALEYAVSATSPDESTEWKAVTTTEFTLPDGDYLYVRTKEIDAAQDEKGNKAGYAAASDSVTVPVTDENKGNLITVKALGIAVTSTDGTLKYGSTVTATPVWSVDHVYDGTADGTLAYQWKYGTDDEWTAIEGATNTVYTISLADAVGKKLKCEVIQTRPNTMTYTADGTTETEVASGTLVTEGTLVYSANPAILGGTLDKTKLSGLTFTNQAGTAVTPALAFTDTAVPDGEKADVAVTASLAGYESLTLKVLITVKSPTPTAENLDSWLSKDVTNISLGKFKFVAAAVAAHVQYSTDGESWKDATTDEIDLPPAFYVRIKEYAGTNEDAILASSASEDLIGTLKSDTYTGKRSIKIQDVEGGASAIVFDNAEITLSYAGLTVTANTENAGSVEITDWEIQNETLSDVATVSEDKKSLTFKDNAAVGIYPVTIYATRNGNILSATYIVTIGLN